MAEKILESLEIKTGENTSDKYKLPYNVLADPPDLSVYAKLAGGNTFSGVQTVNAPANISGSEQATAKFKTANGGSITFGKDGANSGTMIRLDQNDGTCRLRFRSSATAGAMVWEQPEQGANLYIDLGKQGADYRRITMPSSSGTLALTSQIPSAVTESTVSGWGFTKNKGTVTSVAVKMNGASKGTVTSSGTIDLGTVLTDASKFATSAQGTKADNAMPKSGGTFTGNISLPKELVFTDNTNPFIKMRTGNTDFYFQSTSGQFGLGPTWDKATHWDSNGNVTFPTTPKVGSSPLALKSDIPDVSGKANLSGGNVFNGTQEIQIDSTTAGTEKFIVNDAADGLELINATATSGLALPNGFTTSGAIDCQQGAIVGDFNGFLALDYSDMNHPVLSISDGAVVDLDGDKGMAGQVFTSNGDGTAPYWSTPAIKSATLTGTTLYLTL